MLTEFNKFGLATKVEFHNRIKKTPNCSECERLLDVAYNWNDRAHPYGAILGPNSNSYVGLILREADVQVERPAGAWGWNDLFHKYPHYRIGEEPIYIEVMELGPD